MVVLVIKQITILSMNEIVKAEIFIEGHLRMTQGILLFSPRYSTSHKDLYSSPYFSWVHVFQSLVFCVVLCQPSFVFFCFIFILTIALSVIFRKKRLLITPIVSLNCSQTLNFVYLFSRLNEKKTYPYVIAYGQIINNKYNVFYRNQ